MATITRSIQHKRDTAALWTSNNPTLLAGQIGIETDGLLTTPKYKIGDGATAWTGLPYASSSGGTWGSITGTLSAQTDLQTALDAKITASGYVGQSSITTLGTITTGTLGGGAKILVGSDATGDMYYNGGSGAITRLAAVATGSVLVSAGTGIAPAYSASPTLTTSLTVPLLIGGTGVGSSAEIRATSGVGSSEFIKFTGGNNGGTEYARFVNGGPLLIGRTSSVGSGVNLQVTSTGSYPTHFEGANAGTTFSSTVGNYIVNTNATTGNYAGFFFSDASFGASSSGIVCKFTDRTNHYGNLSFFTRSTDGALERLYLMANGDVGIGNTASSPSARLHLIKTTEQFRVGYDTSNYYSTTVGSTGIVTFNAVGSGSKFIFSDNIELTQTVTTEAVASDTTVTIVINGTTYKLLARA